MATSSKRFPRDSYEITSPRLIIRTAVDADVEGLHRFMTTPENFPYFPCNTTLQIEKLRGSITRWHEMQPKGLNAFLVIILKETGEVIGQGSYNCFDEVLVEQPTAAGESKTLLTDVGVLLDHKHWRKGLGFEALCCMIDFAVEELGCGVVRTETAAENEPWKALVRSLGLGGVESFGPQSYDANVSGHVWKFDAQDWRAARAGLQRDGKWPL